MFHLLGITVLLFATNFVVACRPTSGSAQRGQIEAASAGVVQQVSYRALLDSTLCLDVAGDLAADGVAIVLSGCAPLATQAWQAEPNTLGVQGFCLDVANANATVGNPLMLAPCVDQKASQSWRFASGHWQLGDTGLCMACANDQAKVGQMLQLAQCGQNDNAQIFIQGPVFTAADPNSAARRIQVVNRCAQDLYANNGISSYVLPQNANITSYLPSVWSGRIWARSDCVITGSQASCVNTIPLTLAELTFDGWTGGDGALMDDYDISLVDGFNITMSIEPQGGSGVCHAPVCDANILTQCAADLQQRTRFGQVIACVSGCTRYHTDADCCQNANDTSATCPQPATAVPFKQACPDPYSYPFDDPTSVWTCSEPNGYTVTFCPP